VHIITAREGGRKRVCDTAPVTVKVYVAKWSEEGRIRFECTQCSAVYPNQPPVSIGQGDEFTVSLPSDRKLMVQARPDGGSWAPVFAPNYIKINNAYGTLQICVSVEQ